MADTQDPRAIWQSLTPAQQRALLAIDDGIWPGDAVFAGGDALGLAAAGVMVGRGASWRFTDLGWDVAAAGRALAIRAGDIGNVVPEEQAKLEAWADLGETKIAGYDAVRGRPAALTPNSPPTAHAWKARSANGGVTMDHTQPLSDLEKQDRDHEQSFAESVGRFLVDANRIMDQAGIPLGRDGLPASLARTRERIIAAIDELEHLRSARPCASQACSRKGESR